MIILGRQADAWSQLGKDATMRKRRVNHDRIMLRLDDYVGEPPKKLTKRQLRARAFWAFRRGIKIGQF